MYVYIVCYSVYFGVLIDCCVSELHAKLCPHRNVWLRLFIVVFQELHCLLNCLHVFCSMLDVPITSPSFIALHLPVLR